MKEIEIDIEEKDLEYLKKMAEKRKISLNDLMVEILDNAVKEQLEEK